MAYTPPVHGKVIEAVWRGWCCGWTSYGRCISRGCRSHVWDPTGMWSPQKHHSRHTHCWDDDNLKMPSIWRVPSFKHMPRKDGCLHFWNETGLSSNMNPSHYVWIFGTAWMSCQFARPSGIAVRSEFRVKLCIQSRMPGGQEARLTSWEHSGVLVASGMASPHRTVLPRSFKNFPPSEVLCAVVYLADPTSPPRMESYRCLS